jgi:hypothetical protein
MKIQKNKFRKNQHQLKISTPEKPTLRKNEEKKTTPKNVTLFLGELFYFYCRRLPSSLPIMAYDRFEGLTLDSRKRTK